MNISDKAKDHALFWNYWRWQYLSRNEGYKYNYEAYMSEYGKVVAKCVSMVIRKTKIKYAKVSDVKRVLADKTHGHVKLWEYFGDNINATTIAMWINQYINEFIDRETAFFLEEHQYPPVDISYKTDADKIIYAIINGGLDRDVYMPDIAGELIEVEDVCPTSLKYVIDMSKSLSQLISEVRYIYSVHCRGRANGDLCDSGNDNDVLNTDDVYYELVSACVGQENTFKVDDTPRAVGLWLWDYIEKEVGQHPPGGRWLAKAIAALKEKFDMATLGYDKSEKETFRKLYRRTNACIEAAEVLSLK